MAVLWGMPTMAQETQTEPLMPGETPKPTKYVAVEEEKEHLVFFQGFTLSADLLGPISYAVSDYGSLEAALRLNLKNTFFPIVEVGYGKCSEEDYNTKISYKTKAPYGRIGLDVNMLKNKFQSNRLYLGARYGISTFEYDMAVPAVTDPIWGGSEAYDRKGISCTSHWAEFVAGVEVQIFKNFHMGWSVRYKREITSKGNDFAKPHCIPGYGYTTNSTCWGGTYNLIFDLNWGMKKSHRQRLNVEVREIPASGTDASETTEESSDEENETETNNHPEKTTDNDTRTEDTGEEQEE